MDESTMRVPGLHVTRHLFCSFQEATSFAEELKKRYLRAEGQCQLIHDSLIHQQLGARPDNVGPFVPETGTNVEKVRAALHPVQRDLSRTHCASALARCPLCGCAHCNFLRAIRTQVYPDGEPADDFAPQDETSAAGAAELESLFAHAISPAPIVELFS